MQLVRAWRETILEQVSESTAKATIMLDLNAQIGASAANKVNLKVHAVEIGGMKDALQAWRNEYESGDKTSSPDTLDRWQLQTIAARAASLNPAALPLIDQIPSPDAPAQDYMTWIDQMIIVFENELAIIERQYEEVELEGSELEQMLDDAAYVSHGLTAFLIVEPLSDDMPSPQPVRPSCQMALIGGLLGVLIWGFIWLGRPIRKGRT